MKKLMIAGLLAMLIAQGPHAQDQAPAPDVIKAAHDGFIRFLTAAVTEDTKTIVGFDANDDLSLATLGVPFRLYDLPAKSITACDGKVKARSLFRETDLWYFPVMIDGSIKMLLYVGKRNGAWERAGLGSAGLAREMQVLLAQYPSRKGFTPILIQERTTGDYLFSIPQIDAYNLTAIVPHRPLADPGRYANLKNTGVTIQELRQRMHIPQQPVK